MCNCHINNNCLNMGENKNSVPVEYLEETVGFLEPESGKVSNRGLNVEATESLSANGSKCENTNLETDICGDPVLLELQKVEEGEIKRTNKTRCMWCRKYVGLLLILVSGIMLTLSSIVVKKLKDYHPFTQAVYRFQGIFLPSAPILVYMQCGRGNTVCKSIWPLTDIEKRKTALFLILRGAMGCMALLSFFFSLKYITVADAMAVGSCNPVFILLLSHLFLHDKCRVFPVVVAFITITGICILARLPELMDNNYDIDILIGIAFASASMLMATLSIVVVRFLKRVHFAIISFVFGIIGIITNITGAVVIGATLIPETSAHLFFLIALAVLTFLAQICITVSLKCEQAGPVSFIRSCNFAFAFLWQYLLLGVTPDAYSIVGALTILTGLTLTTFLKWITALPLEHPCRQMFSFVLK